VSGLFVNFNLTSLHRFYRGRLAEAYIEASAADNKVPLSDLKNTEVGAPYHLISTAQILIGRRREAERTQNFCFSPTHFRSTVTQFWPTPERLAKRFNDLAEVTALSGAALTPLQVNSAPLAVLMTTLNIRMGQWLPHPQHPSWYPWPCALSLL